MGEEKQAEYALGSKVIERFLGDEYFPDKWCPFNALEYMDVNEKNHLIS
jgi:hypothetical protein